MYVAIETFVDPTDGQLVEAGRTHVAASADCLRMFPRRFRKVTGADFGSPDSVARIGGPTSFGRARSAGRKPVKMRSTGLRPYWQLRRESWRLT